MRTVLATRRLVWPREVAFEQVSAAMQVLAAVAGRPVVLEAIGRGGQVEHRLRAAENRIVAVSRQLRAAITGLGVEAVNESTIDFTRAVELRLSSKQRSLRTDRASAISRTVLTALSPVGRDEAVLLQWVLLRPLPAAAVPNRLPHADESVMAALLRAPFGAPAVLDPESRQALRTKRGEAGWRSIGRVAVQAMSPARQQQLLTGVVSALRTAEAPGVQLGVRRVGTSRLRSLRGCAVLRLNSQEVSALCAWPIGQTQQLPVASLGARRLPVPAALPKVGRVVGQSTWPPVRDRPLALTPADSLRHMQVLGPTGVGKSTLLLNLITQDMAAGHAVVVVEPKGDLIEAVLARVPKPRIGDVVLLDPTDQAAMVGFNPLAAADRSPELVADQLLAAFHGLYAANWGPRTSDILHASLLTLARTPGMSLVALPLLLGNPRFRRSVVGRLDDPIGLGGFWASFEAWSEAERTTAIAPVMNKLRPFLTRPTLRRVLGQVRPRFELASVFAERKVLLVNLASGQLGPESAGLLGALVMASLWRAAQARGQLPIEERRPTFIYVDEFQDFLHLPTDLADALTQARRLGVGFALAHQHLGQLSPSVKAAVLANARSTIAFQLAVDDARTMAQQNLLLSAEDFTGQPAFHFYARLVAGGSVQPWASGRSFAAPRERISPDVVRAASRARYGTPISDVDEAIAALVRPSLRASGDVGVRRRSTGGPS